MTTGCPLCCSPTLERPLCPALRPWQGLQHQHRHGRAGMQPRFVLWNKKESHCHWRGDTGLRGMREPREQLRPGTGFPTALPKGASPSQSLAFPTSLGTLRVSILPHPPHPSRSKGKAPCREHEGDTSASPAPAPPGTSTESAPDEWEGRDSEAIWRINSKRGKYCRPPPAPLPSCGGFNAFCLWPCVNDNGKNIPEKAQPQKARRQPGLGMD